MCGEFNYKSNGPFGDENGVRTKKLGPKRENENWGGGTWREALATAQPARTAGMF